MMVVKGTLVTFTTKTDERQRGSLTPLIIIITNRKVSPLVIIITIMLMMIVAVLIIFITYCSLILKRAFKWASRRANLTIQPTTVMDRLTVGRYLTPVMGAIDAE